MMMGPPPKGWLGHAFVATAAILWGLDSFFRIELLRSFSPTFLTLYVQALMLLPLAPTVIVSTVQIGKIRPTIWALLIFSGTVSSGLGEMLFSLAISRGSPMLCNAMLGLQPVFATVLARLVHRDRLAPDFPRWALLAVTAAVILVLDKPAALLTQEVGHVWLSLLSLLCAAIFGAGTVVSRSLVNQLSLRLALALRLLISVLTLLAIAGATGPLSAERLMPAKAAAAPVRTAALFLGYAGLCGGLPLLLYYSGLRSVRATTAAYLELLGAPTSLLLVWGWLGERLAFHQMAALIVLVFAVLRVQVAQARVTAQPTELLGEAAATEQPFLRA